MMDIRLASPSLIRFGILTLLLLMAVRLGAEEKSTAPQSGVLTMTGLKREATKTVTDSMKFHGLHRKSSHVTAGGQTQDKE